MIEVCKFEMPDETNVQTTDALMYFIWEREAIRIAKENTHPAPWTKDPILNKYKFTNIRRKDDRVSKWVIDNVIKPNPKDEIWFALLITRLINWPPALQHLIDNGLLLKSPDKFDPVEFSKALESFRQQGNKVYSGAYMVYPTKMDPGGVKSLAIAKHIILPASKLNSSVLNVLKSNRVESFVNELSKSFGISTFMAGQVAADLTYENAPLSNALDLYDYAPIGPGSKKGLNYLLKKKLYASWDQKTFNETLKSILKQIRSDLEINDMTLHDVQNVMCEFSKYSRTLLNQGKPKTLYKAETEF